MQISFWDMTLSQPSKTTPTVAKSLDKKLRKDGSPTSKSTNKISNSSTPHHTKEEWIASQRASLASLIAMQEKEPGDRTPEICSEKCAAVYKEYDPNTSFSKMCQDSSQADPRLAYVGGLIDGEGCIRIHRQTTKMTYFPVVTVAMTTKAKIVLDQLKLEFGGHIYAAQPKNKKWATLYMWRINGELAAQFLARIQNYLLLKREHAILAIALNTMRKEQGWTPSTRKKAAQMKQEMHWLNQQGPSAPSAGAGWYCPQRDLFNIMPPFSAKWSKSGMIVDGQYYPLKRLALHILEKDGGACVPVPTPTRVDATSRTYHKQKDGTVRLSLAGYARMYPTPTARDWRHVSKGDMLRHTLSLAAIVKIMDTHPGQLNPTFVEWLMGFPIGATELKD
jgi:hypothetical protein